MMETIVSTQAAHLADVYEDLRPLLFSIAYRMLGSVSEARDRPAAIRAGPARALRR
jgi:DNA-directed RNA polymerase specialized sigma24 family protein